MKEGTMAMNKTEELEKRVAACFGDSQEYDGGWFACYEGKWLDVTNDVTSVMDLIKDLKQSSVQELTRTSGDDLWPEAKV